MSKSQSILVKSRIFVNDLFNKRSTIAALFHNFDHTLEVVHNVKEIATAVNLNKIDTETVMIAAWFHDTGYLFTRDEHEERSVLIATDFLHDQDFPEKRIKQIAGCIRATKVPQQPKNLMEQIMSDADLLHLGMNDSIERGEMLRAELEGITGSELPESDWIKESISFFKGHSYHTTYAKEKYSKARDKNLALLQKRLLTLQKKNTKKKQKR